MKVEIDRRLCESSGMCASLLPRVFELQPDGPTRVIAEPRPDEVELVEEAVSLCPVSAIRLVREVS